MTRTVSSDGNAIASKPDEHRNEGNSAPSRDNSRFTYADIQPHLLVRTVRMNVNVLPEQQNKIDNHDQDANGGDMLRSEKSPFLNSLPLPPNCRLFQQLSKKNQNVHKLNTPIELKESARSTPEDTLDSKPLANPTLDTAHVAEDKAISKSKQRASSSSVEDQESQNSSSTELDDCYVLAEKVSVRTGFVSAVTDTQECEVPFSSVNLKYNSMGYEYEDFNNIQVSRPIIAKSLLWDDYNKFNTEKLTSPQQENEQKDIEEKTPDTEPMDPDHEEDNQPKETTQSTIERKLVDQNGWLGRAIENNPCIQELRERIYPLQRGIALGRAFDAGLPKIKAVLTDEHVLNIILQHLVFEGLRDTKKVLEQESSSSYKWVDIDQSLLYALIKEAVGKSEILYDLTICDKIPQKILPKERQRVNMEIDEQLVELGIEEESKAASRITVDVDIWDLSDEEREQQIITELDPVESKEHLYAASFNVLVERLTSPFEVSPNFLPAFLVTYQSFTTPEALFNKLIQRFNIPKHLVTDNMQTEVQKAVFKVLRHWVEDHFSHFDNKLLARLELFIRNLPLSSPIAKNAQLVSMMIRKHQNKKGVDAMDPNKMPAPKIKMETIFSSTLSFFDIDEEEIARQMTIKEWQLFSKIQSQELLNQAWDKTKLQHRAPNVLKMLDHFKKMSLWISSLICLGATTYDRKHRFKMVIKLCDSLRNLGNFNTLNAVLLGLQNIAVRRMKESMDKLGSSSTKSLSDLIILMSENNNHQAYREALRAAAKARDAKVPCIPYLELFLKDISLIDDGSLDYVNNKQHSGVLVNWAKREALYEVISEFRKFQQVWPAYNFLSIHQLQKLLEEKEGMAKDQHELTEISWRAECPADMPSFMGLG